MHEHRDAWMYGHRSMGTGMDTQTVRYTGTGVWMHRHPGALCTWMHRYKDIWMHGGRDAGMHGYMEARTHGHTDIQVDGCTGAWMQAHGHTDTWVHGHKCSVTGHTDIGMH